MTNDQEFKVLKKDEHGVSIFYTHEEIANAQLIRTEGYQEALSLLDEWHMQPNRYKDTNGIVYCTFCHESPGRERLKHKPDCLWTRTSELLAQPDTLPEMPDETDFSSPGPPPF